MIVMSPKKNRPKLPVVVARHFHEICVRNIRGWPAVIFGAVEGIGYAVAEEFCLRGARPLIMVDDGHEVRVIAEEWRLGSRGKEIVPILLDMNGDGFVSGLLEKLSQMNVTPRIFVITDKVKAGVETAERILSYLKNLSVFRVEKRGCLVFAGSGNASIPRISPRLDFGMPPLVLAARKMQEKYGEFGVDVKAVYCHRGVQADEIAQAVCATVNNPCLGNW